MVALVLIVLLFTLIPEGSMGGSRAKLEKALQEFQSAIRFSVNEAILRNSMVRITIDMEKEPMEWAVEYGPSSQLVLPTIEDDTKMSLKDRERQEQVLKGIDTQFNRVQEFAEETKKLPDGIKVVGLASSYLNAIKIEGKLSIYFYPTGEKDSALIFLSSDEELATIEVPPFEDRIDINYSTYSESDLVNLEDTQDNKMKEVFEKWLKD